MAARSRSFSSTAMLHSAFHPSTCICSRATSCMKSCEDSTSALDASSVAGGSVRAVRSRASPAGACEFAEWARAGNASEVDCASLDCASEPKSSVRILRLVDCAPSPSTGPSERLSRRPAPSVTDLRPPIARRQLQKQRGFAISPLSTPDTPAHEAKRIHKRNCRA
eukprot:1787631-Pleurochrysis_carterae.AAC.1